MERKKFWKAITPPKSCALVERWLTDVHFRMQVSLVGSVLWNSAYGAMQLVLGMVHHSAWYYSLAGYSVSLTVMRVLLMQYTIHHQPGEDRRREVQLYRACGWVFLVTNLALLAMVFNMMFETRVVRHHQLTTLAMAAYTLVALPMAVYSLRKYHRYFSPVFSASKAISLATVCVSALTLERSVLATRVGADLTAKVQRICMVLSGGAVSLVLLTMAVYMLLHADAFLVQPDAEKENSVI